MRQHFRFNVASLFYASACIAMGLAITASSGDSEERSSSFWASIYQRDWKWSHGLLAAASVAIAVGLGQQARQIWRAGRTAVDQSTALRFTVGWAVVWRAGLAVLLCASCICEVVVRRGMWSAPKYEDIIFYDQLRFYFWNVCIINGLIGTAPQRRIDSPHRKGHAATTAAGWIAGAVLAAIVLTDVGLITFLVHIAVHGIEVVQSPAFRRAGAYPSDRAAGDFFFWKSVAASTMVVLNLSMLVWAMRTTARRRVARAAPWALLALGVICVAGYDWYAMAVELPRMSPDLMAVGPVAPRWMWPGAVGIVGVLITGGALRLASLRDVAVISIPNVSPPFHHSLLWPIVLLSVVVIHYIETIRMVTSIGGINGMGAVLDSFTFLLSYLPGYLMLAVGVLAAQILWRKFRRGEQGQFTLGELRPRRFAAAWISLALIAVTGFPAVAVYCFAFWFGPWYRWPLPEYSW